MVNNEYNFWHNCISRIIEKSENGVSPPPSRLIKKLKKNLPPKKIYISQSLTKPIG